MSRTVIKINPDWEPHNDCDPGYDHVFPDPYTTALELWLKTRNNFIKDNPGLYDKDGYTFEDNHGVAPQPKNYLWYDNYPPEEERTHFMMVSPSYGGSFYVKSPPLPSIEELIDYLVNNHVSIYGSRTATREEWTKVCNGEELWLNLSSQPK